MESLNVLFTGINQVEVVSETVPELSSGQILVQTQRSLISTGTECICLARNFAPGTHWDSWVQYPFQPGYCNVGRVLAVAPDVRDLRVGDRVASRGPHCQYAIAYASHAVPVPDNVSAEDAAWFGLACIAQNGVRRAEHALGDAVVVIGLGVLGQLTLQYLQVAGAREIIAVDLAQQRLEMAQAHGATRTLAMGVEEARDTVWQATEQRGADVVYDVTGHPAVFAPALGLARRFGKLLLLGDTGDPAKQHLTTDIVTRGVTVVGAHDTYPPQEPTDRDWWTHRNMARLFFTYVQRGQMQVDNLGTHRFQPQDAPQAYEMLLSDRSSAMGVLFDWSALND